MLKNCNFLAEGLTTLAMLLNLFRLELAARGTDEEKKSEEATKETEICYLYGV